MKKIAVLTSGGDSPGMNACIRAIARMGASFGHQVLGIIGGYQGLIDGKTTMLDLKMVENIIQLGGTVIKTSRCDEFMTERGFNKALKFLKDEKFDALVVLGGDGSLRGAQKLMASGVNVIGIPCTIDNDLAYTDFTIGFDTAINTVTNLLNNVRETSSSHDRVCVVEVMGRHSGEIAINAGTASGAEVILVPEVKLNKKELVSKIQESAKNGEKCVLVVVAEGVGTAEYVAEIIKENTGIDAKSMDLGYVQRGGSPSTFDRIIATKMGATAIELINKSKYGIALGIKNNTVEVVKISKVFEAESKFDKKLLTINNIISI